MPSQRTPLRGPHTDTLSSTKLAERLSQLNAASSKNTVSLPKSHQHLTIEEYNSMKQNVVGQISYIDAHVPNVAEDPSYQRLVENINHLINIPLGIYSSIEKNAVDKGYTMTNDDEMVLHGVATAPPSPNSQWGGSGKICLYTFNFIQNVLHYFIKIIPYDNLDQYTKRFKTLGQLALAITNNKRVHDEIIKIDGSWASYSTAYNKQPEYTSITEKFKDWKHLTILVDKAIDEVKELIRVSTKYTDRKDFMNGPKSMFKIETDLGIMKRELCIINKRDEFNMSLESETNLVTTGGFSRRRRPKARKTRKLVY